MKSEAFVQIRADSRIWPTIDDILGSHFFLVVTLNNLALQNTWPLALSSFDLPFRAEFSSRVSLVEIFHMLD